jgi:5-methyltetrahydrofolate--homocysteine methyltransferase
MSADTILNDGLIKGMQEVGRRFRENEYFVPDVLISAKAMKTGSELLKPLLAAAALSPWARCSSARSKATCTTSARTSWP